MANRFRVRLVRTVGNLRIDIMRRDEKERDCAVQYGFVTEMEFRGPVKVVCTYVQNNPERT